MNRRIRVQAPIDPDCATRESVEAAQRLLTTLLSERADTLGVTLNWNTWRTYARKDRRGDLVLTQWARIA